MRSAAQPTGSDLTALGRCLAPLLSWNRSAVAMPGAGLGRIAMDPVTLIIGALAAGALEGVGEASRTAVMDAYTRLKALVSSHLGGSESVTTALAGFEADPDTYSSILTGQVEAHGLAQDPSVIAAAQQLMALVDADGSRSGKYVVDLDSAQGVQIGDNNRQV